MQNIYILIQDCVHNLSNLFTFNPLIQLSSTRKYNSKLIYELKLHDHIKQPIYYTGTNQIKLFHNIDTLIIPTYVSYHNLHKLTHINKIIFYNPEIVTQITKLTSLTSLIVLYNNDGEIDFSRCFHTNLKNLYDYVNCNNFDIKFEDITSFTHLTRLCGSRFDTCIDLDQLLIFRNLKSLQIDVLKNMSCVSELKSLSDLGIHSKWDNDLLVINHPNITRIKIEDFKSCSILECFNLKKLEVVDCEMINLDTLTDLKTLILSGRQSMNVNFNFDVTQCINLEYFQCHGKITNFDSLHFHSQTEFKLKQLVLFNNILEISSEIVRNLTSLHLSDYLKTFDLSNCINLKKLTIYWAKYINLNKSHQLEHLELYNEYPSSNYINCCYFLNLTYLEGNYCSFLNLDELTKLNVLVLVNISKRELVKTWHGHILHMSNLTYLRLRTSDTLDNEIMHAKYLSNCKLKHLDCSFELDDLSGLNTLTYLTIKFNTQTNHMLTKLTRLIYVNIINSKFHLDLRNLTRLNLCYNENTTLPEMKIIE